MSNADISNEQMSLETRLQNVRHKLGQHLTKQYLSRLLDNMEESDHTRVVLQAVIMILGYNYMSDRTLHIIFNKKTTITRIKTWHKCKLDKHKISRIKNWMEFRPATFGETSGYKGDKLLHALRDWCIIMVTNRKRVKKQIPTSDRETQSFVLPKIKSIETPSKIEQTTEIVSVSSKSDTTKTKKITKSKPSVGKSNTLQQTVEIVSVPSKPATKNTPSVAKAQRLKTVKSKTVGAKNNLSKDIQVNAICEEASVGTTALEMHDKSVETSFDIIKPTMISIGSQMGGNAESFRTAIKPIKTTSSGLRNANISRVNSLRARVQGMNSSIDDHLIVLLESKKQLDEVKQDMNNIKWNKRATRKNDQDEWKRQREYVLKKIAMDQTRLQDKLRISHHSTFIQ